MLSLGITAGVSGGSAPAVYNAANEVAVEHFLAGRIMFGEIATYVRSALGALADVPGKSLDALLAADAAARRHVNAQVGL